MSAPVTPVASADDPVGASEREQPEPRGRGWRRFLPRVGFLRRRRVPDRWLAREQRRRRMRLLLLVLLLVVMGAVVWAVAFSSLLAVRSVSVEGLAEESVDAGASRVTTAAAIGIGTPIARVDANAAAQRVAALPWISSVEVRRAWPDAIVIAVTERTPVAVVESTPASEGGAIADAIRQGVDAQGVVFDPPGGLWLTGPVIRGEVEAIPEAVDVVASLPEDISRRVRVVQAVSPDDIRLQLGNDSIVRWGNASEPEFKAEVLAALLNRRAKGYDVSAPELPTTFDERGPKK